MDWEKVKVGCRKAGKERTHGAFPREQVSHGHTIDIRIRRKRSIDRSEVSFLLSSRQQMAFPRIPIPIQPLTRLKMPQLTLFANPGSRSLSLSPQKPTTRIISTPSRKADEQNLRKMHHDAEDMAAERELREGRKGLKKHDDGPRETGGAKGQPGGAEKRERSPEGGGVAGRDAKRHKNAYEISRSYGIR